MSSEEGHGHDEKLKSSKVFETVFLISEIIVIVLFALCTDYKLGMGVKDVSSGVVDGTRENMQSVYPMWQDVHVMIYIGFGFLMVFLKTHSWTAVGFNFLLSAFAFQLALLIVPFWHMVFKNKFERIPLNVNTLVVGDFAAASCMICYGALLGKVDLFQMWLLVIF
jgi:ammonium transporter Rh